MRIMPFMKRKKGIQFAGVGLDTGGGGGGSYVLPPATSETLGGVKVGSGLSVTSDGTLSASGGSVNYSTSRQDTGLKDIDGKTVYVKTVETNVVGNDWREIVFETDAVYTLVSFSGYVDIGNNHNALWIIPTYETNMQIYAYVDLSTKKLFIRVQSSGTHRVRFTIKYTLS